MLDAEVPVDFGEAIICDAYVELSTNRPIGMGAVGPIPGWIVDQWCESRELDYETSQHFKLVVRIVDNDALRRQASRAK